MSDSRERGGRRQQIHGSSSDGKVSWTWVEVIRKEVVGFGMYFKERSSEAYQQLGMRSERKKSEILSSFGPKALFEWRWGSLKDWEGSGSKDKVLNVLSLRCL